MTMTPELGGKESMILAHQGDVISHTTMPTRTWPDLRAELVLWSLTETDQTLPETIVLPK